MTNLPVLYLIIIVMLIYPCKYESGLECSIILKRFGSVKLRFASCSFSDIAVTVQSVGPTQLFCDTMVYSLPGSSVHGISKVRTMEWVATSFSSEFSQSREPTHIFCTGRQILYH